MSEHEPIAPPRPVRVPSPARVWVPALSFMLIGVLGAALGHVWVRLQQLQTGYALSHERREARVLAETQKRLRLEAAVLKQPQRIERIARVRLGMTAPDPNKIHVVRVTRTAQRSAAARSGPARGPGAGGAAARALPPAAAPAAAAGPVAASVAPADGAPTEVRP